MLTGNSNFNSNKSTISYVLLLILIYNFNIFTQTHILTQQSQVNQVLQNLNEF